MSGRAPQQGPSDAVPWQSYATQLSLLTDPEYLAWRLGRRAARLLGRPWVDAPPRQEGAATPDPEGAALLDGLEVDLVYLWVAGQDPAHHAKRNHWLEQYGLSPKVFNPSVRYVEDDELRYALRSVERHAPWVRRVVLVTDAQVPAWLDRANPRVTVVDHTEFMDPAWLPTFNSQVIESQLHNVPGLAEHFVVCDDDMFFGAPCRPSDFFAPVRAGGVARVGMKVMLSASRQDWIVPMHQVTHDPLARLWMAGWNNVKIELERRRPWRKIRFIDNHQVKPNTRSDMAETVRRFPDAYRRTIVNRFRSTSAVHFGRLTRYRCLSEGRAVQASLPSRVFRTEGDLAVLAPDAMPALFCVNGGPGGDAPGGRRELERLFPEPSAFELPAAAPAGTDAA